MKKTNLNQYLLSKYGEKEKKTITDKLALQQTKYIQKVKK